MNVIDLDTIMEENKKLVNKRLSTEIKETNIDILDNLESTETNSSKTNSSETYLFNESNINSETYLSNDSNNSNEDITINSNKLNNNILRNKTILKKAIKKLKSNAKINKKQSITQINESYKTFDITDMDFSNINNNENLKKLEDLFEKIENKDIKDKILFLKDIFEIFKNKQYVMFLKKKKIEFYEEITCFNCLNPYLKTKNCNQLNLNDFHGCLFLPIEYIDKILLILK